MTMTMMVMFYRQSRAAATRRTGSRDRRRPRCRPHTVLHSCRSQDLQRRTAPTALPLDVSHAFTSTTLLYHKRPLPVAWTGCPWSPLPRRCRPTPTTRETLRPVTRPPRGRRSATHSAPSLRRSSRLAATATSPRRLQPASRARRLAAAVAPRETTSGLLSPAATRFRFRRPPTTTPSGDSLT